MICTMHTNMNQNFTCVTQESTWVTTKGSRYQFYIDPLL